MALSRVVWRDCVWRQALKYSVRSTTTVAPAPVSDDQSLTVVDEPSMFDNFGKHAIPARLGKHKFVPTDFKEHPDRDLVNFPFPVRREYGRKVRFGFLPDTWFTALYNKTGVTGPYLFTGGFAVFLVSKEIYILNEEFDMILPLFFILYCFQRFFAYDLSKTLNEQFYAKIDAVESGRTAQLHGIVQYKKFMENEVKCTEVLTEAVAEMQKETVALQSEVVYRSRIHHIFNEAKRRVDYMLESANARKRFEHRHMIDWIVDQVMRGITPDQERAMTAKCIGDLKLMAQTA